MTQLKIITMKNIMHRFKWLIAGAFFLSAILVSFAQMKQTASVEGITEYQMDNGLKVLLFPDNSSQTITVNITYKVGSRHEGYGEKGMAHLLEHMLFKGTPNHPDIPNELTSRGTRPNGTTYYDRTNYYETFNATEDNLEWALDLEADRMLNSYVAKKDLESEFTVVRNEFEMGENDPSGVLMDKVINSAFLWHNYGNPTIGNRSDIERVPIENLQAFYKKYYRPDNAVLMVTGKFDKDKTLELIEEKFGVLKNPNEPLRDIPTIEPPQDGEKRVTLSRVGDLQVLSAMYHTAAGSHEDYAALALIEDVLTDQPSGRLYKALVESKQASSIWSYSPFTKEPGFMYFNVDVPSDKSLQTAENTLLGIFDDLKNNPITEEELKRAKANLGKQYDQIVRNSSFLATFTSEFIGAGDWRLMFIHRDRVADATLEQVNEVMNRYFINTNRTVGNFIPTKIPVRIDIPHTENLEELVTNYKGKEGLGEGEAFDVSYENIQNRLETGMLENSNIEYGFINKNNRGETVNLTFIFRNGNVNDLMNKGKAASYTARMLNKGTTTKSRQEIEDKLSEIKSSINFSGSNGRTNVYISSTKEHLMEALDLMTDMLKNPVFDAEELEKLKTQDAANIEANMTEPSFLVQNRLGQITQKFEKGHPSYNMTIEEDLDAIRNTTVEDLKAYHKDFYGISNSASLVAIGNIDEQELKNYFESEFSDFKSNLPYTEIANPYMPVNPVNENILTPDKKNAMSIGLLSFEASQYDKEYAALQVAGSIFGGGFLNSRVATRLRQQDGVSYGAGGGINVDSDPKDRSSAMFVYAIYAPENASKVQKGFKEEVTRYIQDGITQEELDDAIKGWVEAQSVSRAKDNELASIINNNMYWDRDMMFQKGIEENVKSLTVEDVNAAIKKYFKEFNEWAVVNGGDFESYEIKNEDKEIED